MEVSRYCIITSSYGQTSMEVSLLLATSSYVTSYELTSMEVSLLLATSSYVTSYELTSMEVSLLHYLLL